MLVCKPSFETAEDVTFAVIVPVPLQLLWLWTKYYTIYDFSMAYATWGGISVDGNDLCEQSVI